MSRSIIRLRRVSELTPREWDLLQLITGGLPDTQIARQLALSERTAHTHLENIYGRLQGTNRTAAVIRVFSEMMSEPLIEMTPVHLPIKADCVTVVKMQCR